MKMQHRFTMKMFWGGKRYLNEMEGEKGIERDFFLFVSDQFLPHFFLQIR